MFVLLCLSLPFTYSILQFYNDRENKGDTRTENIENRRHKRTDDRENVRNTEKAIMR